MARVTVILMSNKSWPLKRQSMKMLNDRCHHKPALLETADPNTSLIQL